MGILGLNKYGVFGDKDDGILDMLKKPTSSSVIGALCAAGVLLGGGVIAEGLRYTGLCSSLTDKIPWPRLFGTPKKNAKPKNDLQDGLDLEGSGTPKNKANRREPDPKGSG